MTQPNNYPYLVTWFEIPAAELDRAAKFYSDGLGVSMRVDQIGRERLSVFPHQKPSVGGCLTVGGQPPASAIPKVTSWVACASLSRCVVPTDRPIRTGRRFTTPRQLASWLELSQRTIYRDIQDLSLSGVPIEGEAGSGHRMGREFEVRPIMFTIDEVRRW
jgi:hypothetical protein